MRILIVCSKNSGNIAPFITDQTNSLEKTGIEIDFFTVVGKGIKGYLKCYKPLHYKIKTFKPDLIHAHYGLSGLLANLQRRIPVITTYHGSDINDSKVYPFSKVSMFFSAYNIFVSEKNKAKSGFRAKSFLIPCGVDIQLFKPFEKIIAREQIGLKPQGKYILFSGAFHNKVKNAGLAIKCLENFPDVELLELKGYTREQVVLLMNAVDAVLMTSYSEGSPQFIKEAMACNCPIVTVEVGDVAEVIGQTEGCFISSYNESELTEKIEKAIQFNNKTQGRNRIIELGLNAETIVEKLTLLYNRSIK